MPRTLIITSKAPGNPEQGRVMSLAQAIAESGREVGVLFVGDGVYSLVPGALPSGQVAPSRTQVKLFASLPDLEERGMSSRVPQGVQVVDHDQMVDLIMDEYSNVLSYL